MLTRRRFLQASGSLLLAAGGLGSYAWFVEPHWLDIVERALPIRDLPASLDGATLVQLSDLHVGLHVSDDYIFDVFSALERLGPDIVVITGDLTGYHPRILEQAQRVYQRMPHGRLATLAVLGNHDYGVGWSDLSHADGLASAMTDLGIRILRNEVAEVLGLHIVGLDDLWARKFLPEDALAQIDPTVSALALSHNPDTADLGGWSDFDGWILAGHTHGGQCRPPFLPPPVLPVENQAYTSGEFALSGGRRMYISRGVGHLRVRARFNVRPEVTVFRLRPA
jgi:predicted MPP superfamily phosphohydrolase